MRCFSSIPYLFFIIILDLIIYKVIIFLKHNVKHPAAFGRDVKPIAINDKRQHLTRNTRRNLFPIAMNILSDTHPYHPHHKPSHRPQQTCL